MAVMYACKASSVKRCVVTSSVAAIKSGFREDQLPAGNTFDESHWAKLDNPMHPYAKSKTLAEKAAWDFWASLPEAERFELVVINPSLIQGPSLGAGTDSECENFIKGIVTGSFPEIPRQSISFVDVRDVASAHLQALKVDEAKNRRFIVSGEDLWIREYA